MEVNTAFMKKVNLYMAFMNKILKSNKKKKFSC